MLVEYMIAVGTFDLDLIFSRDCRLSKDKTIDKSTVKSRWERKWTKLYTTILHRLSFLIGRESYTYYSYHQTKYWQISNFLSGGSFLGNMDEVIKIRKSFLKLIPKVAVEFRRNS